MKRSLAKETVARYRSRALRRGWLRLEVLVPRQDAALVRALAALLRKGPAEAAASARKELNARVRAASGARRLKDLLASAPLADLDLQRSPEVGRSVELP